MLDATKTGSVVLVADDDDATRYVISRALEHEGFRVIEACNGQEAIDVFEKGQPDVILLDVEMPGTNGYQACSTIRRSARGADLPIVMVTGHDDSDSIQRSYEVGATDFIAKPINWSLIVHRIRYILRGARNFHALGVIEAENQALISAIPDSIFIVDSNGVILKHLSGQDAPEYRDNGARPGNSIAAALPVGLGDDIARCINSVLLTRENTVIEYPIAGPQGKSLWYESRFVQHGERKVLVIIRDISERKHAEKKIHSLAYFDSLTGLPNRSYFKKKFQEKLEESKSTSDTLAVFNIDLNRFKRINNTLGTSTGDAVLVKMAVRLSEYAASLRQDNAISGCTANFSIARVGGNEFALLIAGPPLSLDFTSIAEGLRKFLAKPLMLQGHDFVVTASIGVATYPENGQSAEILLKNAESARDAAKHLGSNSCQSYRSSMNSSVSDWLKLENELRRALENDGLSIYYQPKYCMKSLGLSGAEALIRWFHPERGEIPPAVFIPIAEESGLITDLGCWVADKVCEQVSSWQYFGLSPVPVAINISGREFALGDPVVTLTQAIRKAGIPASALELEITETVLMSDIRSVTASLHSLREEGFCLAVDDFGTGYSSLRYLHRFPVDVLKIDSSFVRSVEKNSESRAICAAIIAMARSLGLKVVGEGVETKWQFEFLKRQACDTAQGFLLSKPLSSDNFADQLNRTSSVSKSGSRVIQLSSRR